MSPEQQALDMITMRDLTEDLSHGIGSHITCPYCRESHYWVLVGDMAETICFKRKVLFYADTRVIYG